MDELNLKQAFMYTFKALKSTEYVNWYQMFFNTVNKFICDK